MTSTSIGTPRPSPPRVVVTGCGAISPLGLDAESLWGALQAGRSGIAEITQLADAYPMRFAAEAREFDGKIECFGELPKELTRAVKKGMKLMCREIQMGIAAAQRALQDAALTPGDVPPERFGVSFGSDYMMTQPAEFLDCFRRCMPEGEFDFRRWGAEGLSRVEPLWLLKYLPNMPASHIAIYNDFRGPSNSLTMRECSSNLAIAEGYEMIRRGAADAMIAGSTGTRIHPLRSLHIVLQEQVAVGESPEGLCRPFDLHRRGQVLGEGAGALVLESADQARRRGARPLAEILGHGASAVVDRRGVAQLDASAANAMRSALRSAGLRPDQIGHLNAHGLGATRSDALEAKAIREVFGQQPPPVVALKSYLGNLGAGSGTVEAIVSLLAMRHGWLPPVAHYRTPDPDCPLRVVTASDPATPGQYALSLNFTPTGQASALVLGTVPESEPPQ